MSTKSSRSKLIESIYSSHKTYWEQARPDLERYRDIYNIDFFHSEGFRKNDDLSIQVADANSFVEGYIASLFSKAPAVRAVQDIKANTGNEAVAEAIANRFLFNQQETLTRAARLSLIFPMSFFKILPAAKTHSSVLDNFTLLSLNPWEVILDMTAPDWDSQRWVGHICWMPIKKAQLQFGNKDFKPEQIKDYFTDTRVMHVADVPEEYQYIRLVEFYDLIEGKRIFWSPNYKNGDILEEGEIPLTDLEGDYIIPIVPLYLCTHPEQPLKGFSTLKKIYDQIREKNLLRSHWAQSIRRDTRQIVYPKGAFDEESLSKLEAGLDNSFIPHEKGVSGSIMTVVPNLTMSTNHQIYLQQVEADLQRASVLAPFAKGLATNATATEINALAQYTSSEIGKMARVRDAAIEQIAAIYIRLIQIFLEDEDERVVLTINNDLHVLKSSDLEGKFKIVAVDQGSAPLAAQTKKQEFLSLMPSLVSLGATKESILQHLGALFDLPEGMLKLPPPEPVAAPADALAGQQLPLPVDPNQPR